jgi:hypothetical protein
VCLFVCVCVLFIYFFKHPHSYLFFIFNTMRFYLSLSRSSLCLCFFMTQTHSKRAGIEYWVTSSYQPGDVLIYNPKYMHTTSMRECVYVCLVCFVVGVYILFYYHCCYYYYASCDEYMNLDVSLQDRVRFLKNVTRY